MLMGKANHSLYCNSIILVNSSSDVAKGGHVSTKLSDVPNLIDDLTRVRRTCIEMGLYEVTVRHNGVWLALSAAP